MKENEEIWFIRWGNLQPIKHKESRTATDNDFHIAPKVNGVYAFPRGYVERFLIGGSYTNHSRKLLLDENGNKIVENDFYDFKFGNVSIKPQYKKLLKKYHIREKDITSKYDEESSNLYMYYYEKPKKFKYTGEIWHHLGEFLEPSDIIEHKRQWYKTTYKDYIKALHKANVCNRFYSYLELNDRHGNPHSCPSFCAKDMFEVFIEHIK